MAFRDELGASRARMDVLQQRVAELEADNRALRERTAAEEPKRRSRALPAIVAVLMVSAVGGTYALARESGLGAALLLFGLSVGAIFLLSRALIEHVRSGFVLVLSGRRYAGGRGYRLVHDGWVLRMPFVELADRLDVRPRRCEVDVENAYAKDNAALRLRLSGLIRLASAEPAVHRAVERFLAKPMEEVDAVAIQTLKGGLRDVLASTPSTEVVRAPATLARAVAEAAESDLEKLGLVVERFSIEVLPTSPR